MSKIKQACDRCLEMFDQLETIVYKATCSEGVIEFPAKYCTECANICESEMNDSEE
jgi:hypothetical protein